MRFLRPNLSIAVAVLAVMLGLSGPLRAAEEKVFAGTIEITGTQFAFIASGKMGSGVVKFQGEDYYFDAAGIGAGGVGLQKVRLVGAVYNMTDISQFPGSYTEARIGATVGKKSKGMMTLSNANGVIMDLKSSGSVGLSVGPGVDGVNIQMRQ